MVLVGAILGLLTLSGCGGGGVTKTSQVRAFNGVADTTVDIFTVGDTLASGLGFNQRTSYRSVNTVFASEIAAQLTGSTSVLASISTSLAQDQNYTVFLKGTNSPTLVAPSFLVTQDDVSAPTSGNFRLRVVALSPTIGSIDVYVTDAGTDITTVSPTFSNVDFEEVAGSTTFPAGSKQVRVVAAGTKSPLFFNLNPYKVFAGGAQTLVITTKPGAAASAVNGIILVDR